MGKADLKRDYYGDLELDQSADQEEIKKQFKKLARLYHPDRNPGHEVEFVSKFQIVQQAHEILIDPVEKQKYDNGRAKLARQRSGVGQDADPYSFRSPADTRPAPQPAPSSYQYPPPPKDTPKQRPAYPTQGTSSTAASPGPSTADKFSAFTRRPPPPPQSWNASRYDNTSRADNARAWGNLKSNIPSQQMPPPPPPRGAPPPRQHPTAQRPGTDAPSPDPGYPGLSRTQSARRGFAPNVGGADEPMAPRTSAYSYVRSDRTHATSAQSYATRPPASMGYMSPEVPLRHARSTEQEFGTERPGLRRSSSKYATRSGERTNLNEPPITRSASFRGIPTERKWEDRGPASRPVSGYGPQQTRYESTSPSEHHRHHHHHHHRRRDEYSSSEATSSDEDEPIQMSSRPKATPRPTRSRKTTGETRSQSNDPALMGQYPSTNYTKIVGDGEYLYPPPENPTRKPFANLSPNEEKYAKNVDAGFRHVNREDVQGAGGATEYAPPLNGDAQNGIPEGKFFAADWHAELHNAEDMFRPNESQRRRSPTKSSKPEGRPTTRNRARSRGDDLDTPHSQSMDPNVQPHTSTSDLETGQDKPRGKHSNSVGSNGRPAFVDEKESARNGVNTDAMDLDEDVSNRTPQTTHSNGIHRRDGIDLSDLSKEAPFASSSGGGLKNMDELASSLPFNSQAADTVHIERTRSHSLRGLDLPKPPRTIVPPAGDRLTRENWIQYTNNMTAYMQHWNEFNDKMIEHFRGRQEQVTHNMSKNWIAMLGDGPSADDCDTSQSLQAGYAAYMTWLEDDAICRTWWEKANDRHRECLEDLGEARHCAKKQLT